MKDLRVKNERGALTTEASFVFPVMLLVILLMLVLGNAYYQKCRMDQLFNKAALDGAAYCADPQLEKVEGGEIPSAYGLQVYPYRAFSGAGADEMEAATGTIKKRLDEQLEKMSTGLFNHMRPENTSVKMDYENSVVSSDFYIEAGYTIGLPVRLLFMDDWFSIDYKVRYEMPVGNATEWIRNADMAEDYMEQYGIKESYDAVKNKIIKAIATVKDWIG